MVEEFPEKKEENLLTPIQPSYTVSGTDDEVDKLMIKNFLDTLAEIALAIASREVTQK